MAYKRIEGKLEGGEELLKALAECGVNVRKVVGAAMKVGAKVIAKEANATAKTLAGGKGVIVSVRVTRRAKDHITVSVGPVKSKWYYRFFETGTRPHEIKGNPFLTFFTGGQLVEVHQVHHPGMAARPFLRPAFDARSDEAARVVGEKLKAALEQAKIEPEAADD